MKWQTQVEKKRRPSNAGSKEKVINCGKDMASACERLESSKFRWLNEQLYTHPSMASHELFLKTPALFEQYHVGFSRQVQLWPVNPVDIIINELRKMVEERQPSGILAPLRIVDLGCGEAKLHDALHDISDVTSIDLVSQKPHIIAADIAKVMPALLVCIYLNTNFYVFI
jgi:Hypothetical methyltransferase